MFGWGMIDNTVWCFLNVVMGFEFESKIVPFGAKLMFEMTTVFIVAGSLYLWGEISKESFRLYFICQSILGVFSVLILYFFKFKKKI